MFIGENLKDFNYGVGYEHLNYDFDNNLKNNKFVTSIKKDIIN